MAKITVRVIECGHTSLDFQLVASGHPEQLEVYNRNKGHHCGASMDANGRIITHPIYTFVIEHPDGLLLIDTGMSSSTRSDWKHAFYPNAMPYHPEADELFVERLDQLHLKPADFKDVVLTHLHTDHAGNTSMFTKTNARIIVHEDELRGAVTVKGGMIRDDDLTLWGLTSQQGFTRRDFGCLLPDRATLVFGDQQIYPGIWTVSFPGHTWGTMGVAVKLENTGWILLASDHIYMTHNWGRPFIPSILNHDPTKWAHSALKTRRMMDKYKMRIFPGHDDKIIVPADNDAGYVLEPVRKIYD
jgi:N-acyl homoserine lactone hydrolase